MAFQQPDSWQYSRNLDWEKKENIKKKDCEQLYEMYGMQ